MCIPGETSPCYSGPDGTEGVGSCKAGQQSCNEHGTAFGPCGGQVLPSPDACNTPEDEDCDGAPAACTGEVWSKGFGDASVQGGYDIAADAAGSVVAVGVFAGKVDFGGGPLASAGGSDAFIVKFDASGKHLWSKGLGDGSDQWGGAVAADAAGNVVVTGMFAGTVDFGGGPIASVVGDAFVVKFDPSGKHLWSKGLGDEGQQHGYGVATDAGGSVLLTGGNTGAMDFGDETIVSAGSQDVFIAKLAP